MENGKSGAMNLVILCSKCPSTRTSKYKCPEAEICLTSLKHFRKAVDWRMRVGKISGTNSEKW